MNMYLVKISKLKHMNRNDCEMKKNFFGFLAESSNHMKRNIYKEKEFYPILIINPIFPNNFNNNNESVISEDLESNRFSHSINNQNREVSKNKVQPVENSMNNFKNEPIKNNYHISLNEKFCLGYID